MLASKKSDLGSSAAFSGVSSASKSRRRVAVIGRRSLVATRIGIAAAMAVGVLHRSASAASTYTIQRIGVPSAAQSTDAVTGLPLDTNAIIYSDSSGNVVGSSALYFGGTPFTNALWYYNGTTSTSIGLTGGLNNGVSYQKSNRGNNVGTSVNTTLGNSRVYNNGYVVGISQRYDSAGTSLGSDAFIFNGNGATSNNSVAIPIPSTVIVPTASAQLSDLTSLGLSSSNLAYNVPSQNAPANGGTLQTMASGSSIQAGTHGNAAGLVGLYYNTTGTTWASTATDAFYFDGTATKTIGLVNGNNVTTSGTGSNKIARSSSIVRLNDSDQVLGYSSYYGGGTTTTATGNDIWLYDPANATGTGANGTTLIAPTASSGFVYASGNVTPNYLTNSGIVSSAFQQYASSDTARATTLSQDTFLYNSHVSGPSAWTQVGLTGSAYTFYSNATKTGVGGSSFGFVNYSYAPPVNENGQAEGFTKRTASPNVALGQDAWVYYPAAHVPSGAVAGTMQIGFTGGAYETNTGTGVQRTSTPTALTATGAVVGTSNRFTTGTVTTSAGADAWIYDPAHGITTTKQIGLFGDSIHETTVAGATNVTRSSSITAIGSQGMIGGTSNRYVSATSSTSTGLDAWVFDPITNKTYNVDDSSIGGSSPTNRASNFAATVAYISDSGVVLGYDSLSLTNTGSPAYNYSLFDWYLAYDSTTGLNDIPTFQRLYSAVDPASLSAGDWSSLFTAPGSSVSAPSMTADGRIIGLGGLNADSPNSYVPFQLTPSSVPEPTSVALLLPSAALLLSRRKRSLQSR